MNQISTLGIAEQMDALAVKAGFKPMSQWTEEERLAVERKIDEHRTRDIKAMEKARRDAQIAAFCPPAMREFDILHFPGAMDGLKTIWEWPARPDKARGLWIYGETGRGKTRALYAVLQQCLKYDPKVMDSAEFSAFAREAAMSEQGEHAKLGSLVSRGIFAIDDLGKRMTKVGWETLFTLIDRRMNNSLPTLFTANFKPKDIESMLPDSLQDVCISGPIIRRIRESCIQVIL